VKDNKNFKAKQKHQRVIGKDEIQKIIPQSNQ